MRRFYLLLVVLLLVTTVYGQTIDPTFQASFTSKTEAVAAVYLPDGKYILAGGFVRANGQNISGLARFNADGTIDATYQNGTGAKGKVEAMALQSDGKLLVAGRITGYNGTATKGLFRLNADGTLDNTFNQIIVFDNGGIQFGIYLQSDGKIVVTGPVSYINGLQVNEYIIRLNADGTHDSSFDAERVYSIYSIAFQADGKMIIGGSLSAVGSTTVGNIARLNANGTLDTSFNTGAGFNSLVQDVKIVSGRIIVGGWFTQYKGAAMKYLVALTSTGAVDGNFTANNLPNGTVEGMATQSDGKIVVAGNFTSIGSAVARVARLSTTGAVDATFNSNIGTGPGPSNSYFEFATLSSTNEILLIDNGSMASFNGQARKGLVLLSNQGVLKSTTETLDLQSVADVVDMAASGNKLLVSHRGNYANYQASAGLELINEDGSLDATFRNGLTFAGQIGNVFADNSGKFLLGGMLTSYRGSTVGRIVRVDASGAIDNTFLTNTGTGFADGVVMAFAQQSDGKLLVGGNFSGFNGTTRRSLLRLNSDGTLDNTFNSANGFAGGDVNVIKIQSDGKVLVGGAFSGFGGISRFNLVRLNANGTIDNTFAVGTGLGPNTNSAVRAIEIGDDGKILVGGGFTDLNGVSLSSTNNSYFLKLDANGVKDTQHTNQNMSLVEDLQKQPDGKILIVARNSGLRRLKSDGTLDPYFINVRTESPFSTWPTAVVTINGNIYGVGTFALANDLPVRSVFKANMPAVPTASPVLNGSATSSTANTLTWADNSTTESGYEIERSLSATSGFAVIASKGANITTHADNGLAIHTTYYYRMRMVNASGYSPYSNVKEVTTLQAIPAAPTTPVVTNLTSSSQKLTWVDASSNESNFIIKRSINNLDFTTVATLPANTTTYEDAGLTPGTYYYYRITSSNELGESTFLSVTGRVGSFNMVAGTLTVCGGYLFDPAGEFANYAKSLDVVTTLQPESAGALIELNFESFSTNAGFDVLSIYDGASVNDPFIASYSGSSVGTVRVRASSASGKLTLRFQSSTLTTLSGWRIKLGCVFAPLKPTNPVLTAVNMQQVNLTWADNATDETGYEVERSLSLSGFTRIGTLAANATQFTDNTVVNDVTYYYRLRAKGATDNSDYTAPIAIAFGTGGVWKSQKEFSGPGRTDAVAFTIGDKGYVGTGSAGAYTADIRAFDPATNDWTSKSGYGGSIRGEAVAFVVGSKAFVGTGFEFDREKDLWEYNDQTNTWTQRADFTGSARTGAVAFVVDGKAYVGTGRDAAGVKNDFYVYNPADNTWAVVAPFPGDARDGAVAFSIDGAGYVGTGRSSALKKDFWKYVPSTNTWTAIADFPSAREEAVAFVVNGNAYVGTGDAGNYQRDMYRYNASLNTWVKVVSFGGTARLAAAAFAIGAHGYVATGYDATANLKDVWQFTEQDIPAAPVAPSALTAVVKSSSSIELSWTDNTTNETGFVLQRSLTTEDNYTNIATLDPNTMGYVDSGLAASSKYYYRIKAVTATGESSYTLSTNATTLPLPPAAPLGLTAEALSSSRIIIKWSTSLTATQYIIERSVSENGTYAVVGGSPLYNSTEQKYNLTDISLSSNTRYYYRVAAKNAGGTSAYSDVVSAQTLVTSIVAPGNLAYTQPSPMSIRLTWVDNSSDEDGFELERAVGEGSFVLWRSLSANAASSDEAGLSEGEIYSYRVKARKGQEYSDLSNSVSVTILPASPSNLTGTLSDDLTAVTLVWADNSSKELGYVIERSVNGDNFAPFDTVVVNSFIDENLTADQKLSYRVYAYMKGASSAPSNTVIFVTTGLENEELPLAVTSYPNPAKTEVTLEFNSSYVGVIGLQWYDVYGRELKTHEVRNNSAADKHVVNVKEIGTGMLLLKATAGHQTVMKKIVVE